MYGAQEVVILVSFTIACFAFRNPGKEAFCFIRKTWDQGAADGRSSKHSKNKWSGIRRNYNTLFIYGLQQEMNMYVPNVMLKHSSLLCIYIQPSTESLPSKAAGADFLSCQKHNISSDAQNEFIWDFVKCLTNSRHSAEESIGISRGRSKSVPCFRSLERL